MAEQKTRQLGLRERLDEGAVICAEGYLFELERRGYVQAGPFVPDVVLDNPNVVRQLHRDFVHAGSDVVEAFTYYAHRDKLRIIGKEDLLEPLNRQALEIAREVALESGTLFAGNICNTNAFEPTAEARKTVRAMFEEQVGWAVDAEVDFIIAETYSYTEEALIALDVVRAASKPAVVTIALHSTGTSREGHSPTEFARRLEDAGADVVGLNCSRGPATMLAPLKEIREAVSCYVAALPVPYRTTSEQPTFQALRDPCWHDLPDDRPFPTALDPFVCNRYEIGAFGKEAFDMGVRYLGACCGAGPHHIRSLAEALGRQPPASRYSPDMAKHSFYGTDKSLIKSNLDYAKQL